MNNEITLRRSNRLVQLVHAPTDISSTYTQNQPCAAAAVSCFVQC